MSTIAAGQIAGMSRPAALEFSFFLSMPTMAVAVGIRFSEERDYRTITKQRLRR
jgi:undecaprenyl-diphosphatase